MPQPRIQVLPDLLVNKIAAGEVVERPASVVKELIDNALDAGASRVAVELADGGKELIRVTDDGRGMDAEDLRLCVLPHATSKITAEDDLYTIRTMGFRGEALASISAVSRMRVISRPHDTDEANEVRVAGKVFEYASAAGAPPGTTIEVRDLFFNVPTRRKFLKANSTETGHINEQVARFAIAFPEVGFETINNGRTTLNAPGTQHLLERIARFYGEELASDLLHTVREERGVRLEVFAAPPSASRATAQWQYTFVNRRHIRDRFLQHAIREAHRGLIDPHRHGVVFVYLDIAPDQVDVNVHPTKIEVRWADSHLVHSLLLSALREMFQQADLAPALRTRSASPDPAEQERLRREFADLLRAAPPIVPGRDPAVLAGRIGENRDRITGSFGSGSGSAPPDLSRGDYRSSDPLDTWRKLYGRPTESGEGATGFPAGSDGTADSDNAPSSADLDAARRFLDGQSGVRSRAVQLHNLYLVAETDDGIIIVDQHALHERVMYEELKRRLASGTLEAQRLLLPDTLRVTPRQASLLESNTDLLQRLGIEITPFGPDSVAVHTFPALLKDTDVPGFMRDLLDKLESQPQSPQPEEIIHELLDMMACKAAVKAGDPLSDEEVQALMAQRHLVDKSSSCPHGRPTALRLSRAELDRQFKRT
ncbi:MAG: DNA mismatch repair endonuclease MutL [Phycisphaerae bacterium]|nr:DNA mismatch repair endonuclease MutL [Phycisphaerae bacterium]